MGLRGPGSGISPPGPSMSGAGSRYLPARPPTSRAGSRCPSGRRSLLTPRAAAVPGAHGRGAPVDINAAHSSHADAAHPSYAGAAQPSHARVVPPRPNRLPARPRPARPGSGRGSPRPPSTMRREDETPASPPEPGADQARPAPGGHLHDEQIAVCILRELGDRRPGQRAYDRRDGVAVARASPSALSGGSRSAAPALSAWRTTITVVISGVGARVEAMRMRSPAAMTVRRWMGMGC